MIRLQIFFFLGLSGTLLLAHPLPDVPVRSFISSNGEITIKVEVDPRCLDDDPKNTPYLTHEELERWSPIEVATLYTNILAFVDKTVAFTAEPAAKLTPAFTCSQATLDGKRIRGLEDPITIIATWKGHLPASTTAYRLKAKADGNLSVIFMNVVDGNPIERVHTLFPGETSYPLPVGPVSPVPTSP